VLPVAVVGYVKLSNTPVESPMGSTGILLPKAGHAVLPMVNRADNVESVTKVFDRYDATAALNAEINVVELNALMAAVSPAGKVFMPWLFNKADAAVICSGVNILRISCCPYIWTAASTGMPARIGISRSSYDGLTSNTYCA
jgi:hypothetical protein